MDDEPTEAEVMEEVVEGATDAEVDAMLFNSGSPSEIARAQARARIKAKKALKREEIAASNARKGAYEEEALF